MNLFEFLDKSKTAYHATENVRKILLENGYTELSETNEWKIIENGKYFLTRNGSALIAFSVGKSRSFNVVAAHSDSPCFKIKASPEIACENYVKLDVEKYGGGIYHTFLDRPLTIAGRVTLLNGEILECRNFVSEKTFVIPSVAIHFNRAVNDGIKLNPQTDLCPVISSAAKKGLTEELKKFADGSEIADCDLFVVPAEKPFYAGYDNELFCSPRIDDLASVYCALKGLLSAKPKAINVLYAADNEEVGNRTRQGACSDFLVSVLKRIHSLTGEGEFGCAVANSFMVSFDGAHAVHPNHPEFSDPATKTLINGGVVIKHHANFNYTTDSLSSAVFKRILSGAGVKYQDFYMRSDLPCGSTLGASSSAQFPVLCVDAGLAQLAMHSATETAGVSDIEEGIKAMTAVYSSAIVRDGDLKIKII